MQELLREAVVLGRGASEWGSLGNCFGRRPHVCLLVADRRCRAPGEAWCRQRMPRMHGSGF